MTVNCLGRLSGVIWQSQWRSRRAMVEQVNLHLIYRD